MSITGGEPVCHEHWVLGTASLKILFNPHNNLLWKISLSPFYRWADWCGNRLKDLELCPACLLSCFSRVRLFVTLWSIACQAPQSMGFSRQEYWSRLPCPPPGYLLDPGIRAASLMPPALAGGFFITSMKSWKTLLLTSAEFPSPSRNMGGWCFPVLLKLDEVMWLSYE